MYIVKELEALVRDVSGLFSCCFLEMFSKMLI